MDRSVVCNRTTLDDYAIAVLVPCFNEEKTVAKVIKDFRNVIPNADIYVYDNNSSDKTAEIALREGAYVKKVAHQGKGNVVRQLFADVDADLYLLVDGDATYHAESAPGLIRCLLDRKLDMVVGARQTIEGEMTYRPGHRFGNALFTSAVNYIFDSGLTDILSGYRVFSRRFVKSFPALSKGFEIETELTIHALELRMPVEEINTPYGARPVGSESKLSTWGDGFKILMTVLKLTEKERPFKFFVILALLFFGTSLLLAYPLVLTWLETGLVPRFPTAILSTGLMILAFLSLVCGLVMDAVTLSRREMKSLFYLSVYNSSQYQQQASSGNSVFRKIED